MHREIKKQKKVVAIVSSLVAITVALYIYQFTRMTKEISLMQKQILSSVLILFIVFVLFVEIKRCMIAYKYSIISDKLIINKIDNKGEENIESLKLKDIIYIGEKSNIPKEYNKIKFNRYYTRDFHINKKIYCIYKKNGKISKFVFEPSNKLITCVCNKKECILNNNC